VLVCCIAIYGCTPAVLRPNDRWDVCQVAVDEKFGSSVFQPNPLRDPAGMAKGAAGGALARPLVVPPVGIIAFAVLGAAAGAACDAASLRHPDAEANFEKIAGRGRGLDRHGASETGAVPVSEPGVGFTPPFDPAVFPDRRGLGGVDRARPGGLRHPYAAAHQSHADLPADQESPGGSTPPWAHQRLESTGRYLGIEVDDALEIAEQTEV
jgi:hypothetical protein